MQQAKVKEADLVTLTSLFRWACSKSGKTPRGGLSPKGFAQVLRGGPNHFPLVGVHLVNHTSTQTHAHALAHLHTHTHTHTHVCVTQ